MHAQALQRGQIGQIVGLPGVIGQIFKPGLGRAQGVFAQGLVVGAPGFEELLEDGRALPRQHPALHCGLVVDGRHGKQIEQRARRPCPAVSSAIDHAGQARMQQGATAHGAGLQGDEELAAV